MVLDDEFNLLRPQIFNKLMVEVERMQKCQEHYHDHQNKLKLIKYNQIS